MRAFLILAAISTISAIYIETNRSHDHRRGNPLLGKHHGRYEVFRGAHSEIHDHRPARIISKSDDKKSRKSKKAASHKSHKHHPAKDNAKPLKDEDYFLYYFDKENNVKYYYPKASMHVERLSKKELGYLQALGGIEGIVHYVGVLVHEHLLLSEKMRVECNLLGASLAKDLIDFFVSITATGSEDLKGLQKIYNQSHLLKRINFNEFIIMAIKSAEKLHVQPVCIKQLITQLDYIRDHANDN